MSSWNLEAIAQGIVDAAVQPNLWVRSMDTIAAETGSVGTVLIPLRGSIPNVPSSETILRSTEAYFAEGWYARDERFKSIPVMIRRGVATDFDFTNVNEMKRNAYYQDF
jgi:hypothetical protein